MTSSVCSRRVLRPPALLVAHHRPVTVVRMLGFDRAVLAPFSAAVTRITTPRRGREPNHRGSSGLGTPIIGASTAVRIKPGSSSS